MVTSTRGTGNGSQLVAMGSTIAAPIVSTIVAAMAHKKNRLQRMRTVYCGCPWRDFALADQSPGSEVAGDPGRAGAACVTEPGSGSGGRLYRARNSFCALRAGFIPLFIKVRAVPSARPAVIPPMNALGFESGSG